MESVISPSQLAVCADSDSQRLFWQDLERYRTMARNERVLLCKEYIAHDERAFSQTALALVGCLERGSCSHDEAVSIINRLWPQVQHVSVACKLGWLADYIRVAYQYL